MTATKEVVNRNREAVSAYAVIEYVDRVLSEGSTIGGALSETAKAFNLSQQSVYGIYVSRYELWESAKA